MQAYEYIEELLKKINPQKSAIIATNKIFILYSFMIERKDTGGLNHP
jgi:hypothetical protein